MLTSKIGDIRDLKPGNDVIVTEMKHGKDIQLDKGSRAGWIDFSLVE